MNKKLYVGNLPYSTTADDLKAMFAAVGTVESSAVITDKFSGRSKGFGFVEMSSAEEAEKAIAEFNQKEVGGRKLTVNIAKPKEDRGNGGGFGGGFNRGY